MDIYSFITNILNAIAWPVSIFFVAFILRKPLSKLLLLLQKIKYKDLEFTFNEKVGKLSNVKKLSPELVKIETEPSKEEKILKLAEKSPKEAILKSWLDLETTAKNVIIDKAKKYDKEIPENELITPFGINKHLKEERFFDDNQSDIFIGLRALRNDVIHNPDFIISPTATSEYINLSNTLTSYLENKAPSQYEMTMESNEEFSKADKEMEKVYNQIVQEYKDSNEFLNKLESSQREWKKFRDAHLESLYPAKNKTAEYGSAYRMSYAKELTRLTKQRTEQLMVWLEGIEEGDVSAGSVKIKE